MAGLDAEAMAGLVLLVPKAEAVEPLDPDTVEPAVVEPAALVEPAESVESEAVEPAVVEPVESVESVESVGSEAVELKAVEPVDQIIPASTGTAIASTRAGILRVTIAVPIPV